LKNIWLEKAKNQFPLCKSCPSLISELAHEHEKSTFVKLNQEFSTISKGLYQTLTCLDAAVNFLGQYIEKGRETQQVPELVIDNLAKDKDELTLLIQSYQLILSKELQNMPLDELQKLMIDFNNRKNKTLLIWDRLKGGIIPANLVGCAEGLF